MADNITVGFVTALERCPALRDACIGKDVAVLRSVRLVSKEASIVALLAVESFSVTMTGGDKDTNPTRAKMLRHTCLGQLTVRLKLCDSFRPSKVFREFLHLADTAFSKVVYLTICLEDEDGLHQTNYQSSMIGMYLKELVRSCPLMKTLTFHGPLSSALMYPLGKACPLLTRLIFCAELDFSIRTESVVRHLQRCLPQVSCLVLPSFAEQHILPKMAANTSLLSLEMPSFSFRTQGDWSSLPPNLQHLTCLDMSAGPQNVNDSAPMFGSLLTVTLSQDFLCGVDLAKLLSASPLLQHLQCSKSPDWREGVIHLNPITMKAAGLRLLAERVESGLTINGIFEVFPENEASVQAIMSSFPRMPRLLTCHLSHLQRASDVPRLLGIFPDVQFLSIGMSRPGGMDDLQLQAVAACLQVTDLHLCQCDKITSTGVLKLCQSLPRLIKITFQECVSMDRIGVKDCDKLLRQCGLDVEVKQFEV